MNGTKEAWEAVLLLHAERNRLLKENQELRRLLGEALSKLRIMRGERKLWAIPGKEQEKA